MDKPKASAKARQARALGELAKDVTGQAGKDQAVTVRSQIEADSTKDFDAVFEAAKGEDGDADD